MKASPSPAVGGELTLESTTIVNDEFKKTLDDVQTLLTTIGPPDRGIYQIAILSKEQPAFRRAIVSEIRRRLVVLVNKVNLELGQEPIT